MKKHIDLKGLPVSIQSIDGRDFISLTDLAKHGTGEPFDIIKSWIKNGSTLMYLATWEELYNPNFKPEQMLRFSFYANDNRASITPQKYIAETGAIGLISKSGRHGGGTWAHVDIALQFCYWLSPPFQLYLIKEFQRLKKIEADRASAVWAAERVKDLLDEARNWMDMVQPPAAVEGPKKA